ncbi:MAG: 3'(2'),5'-bisphosphate nucleotidase CysQ [Flavisolibacter sp.]
MLSITELLEVAKTAAQEAGKAILNIYHSGNFGIELKSDRSPLTLADKVAHDIISTLLKVTGLPILSEEGSALSFEERRLWSYFWLIDPLDGTKEFIKRTGEFTVNIALIQAHIPIAGVIYAPDIDKLYYGSKPTGVTKIDKGEKKQLIPLKEKITMQQLQQKKNITIVASKSHLNEETKIFMNQFPNATLSSMGSSLKLMLLAESRADIYPRLAPTMEWDIAAGDAILRSLNRGVYQTNLVTELLYNKEDLLNPPFIAF